MDNKIVSMVGRDRAGIGGRGPGGNLPPRGPDDTFDGMDQIERRIIVLEEGFKHYQDDMKELKADIKAMRADLSEVKGRVNAMPTTWQMITLVFGVMAGAFAILRFGLPH